MKIKSIKERIKEYFFLNPTAKMRVRQLERMLKLPLPSVIRYCKELQKEGLLKKENISGIFAYSADRTLQSYLLEKRLFNIRLIFESGLIGYLTREYANPTIVLFGSYQRGEDIEASDIDLYIETPKKQNFSLEGFEKTLHRKIQVFNYTNIKKIPNPHLANNIINGITLNGFLRVFA